MMGFTQHLVVYAVSAALSLLILAVAVEQDNPNREASKKGAQRKKEIAKRFGRPLLKRDAHEDIIACDVINPDDIDVTFDSVGGLEGIKQDLHEMVILPLQRPNLFTRGKLLSPQKGILLYGPPGTGKTMLAKAIAKEARAAFINVKLSTLMSKWFGESQKLVSALFSLAYKLQPSIIFIDEVEGFLGHRHSGECEASATIKTEFMSLWDGLTTDQNARVMVIGATNRPEELDDAIIRRLPKAIEVGLPNCEERAKILKVILRDEDVDDDIDYNHLASLCEGYSGSDLKELCKRAAYIPIRELLENEKNGRLVSELPRPLRQADFENTLKTSRTSKVLATEYGQRSQTGAHSRSSNDAGNSIAQIFRFLASMVSMRPSVPENAHS
eukprot:TRINITY_DN929_c0_g1_i1.p1 TRINITY_DN929_c0_g1~~TRINITY_DN929_c0_g1_i1.p1  ORF type:complete len:385 (-),score=79.27 TRINITY_DN929_c0_g1_i1:282-1436(-)